MENIIPPNSEYSENSDSQNPESQFFNSPIRRDLENIKTFPELDYDKPIDDLSSKEKYTLDDMVSLWYHAMIAGGNTKQYTIDSSITPERHIQIIDKLLEDIKASTNPEQAIKLLLSNNMVLLGNIHEIIDKLDKTS